ncbi:hypothetical protein GSI_02810 [Ganoderma sinense ZZ0214-1]|uniref:DUF6534 domain-containing protein n=1 Tax=Ganoderma sinense ZZ0214-1 TaxID=1077348 RepID=A0A2G8SMS3_9APHY|nr:hypothetical protein GSI_02810 [Ganoderma sinense ZZ0214-1]
MSTTAPSGVSPAFLLSRSKESLSFAVVGLVVSTCVYGITILQAYTYYRNHGHDSTCMRSFVAFLFVLDTVSMVLTVDGIYEYVVVDFGDPLLLLKIPSSLAFEAAVGFLLGSLTQCFFAQRLWALSERNVPLVSTIVILALCSLGIGMRVSVHLYTDNNVFSFGSLEIRMLMGFANGLSALCDVVIVVALCCYLHSKRTGFKRTDSIIDRLIVYAVNRGVLTA